MDTHFETLPCGAALGAEIRGLDLRTPLPDPVVAALRRAWHEHLVLLFRDQDLSDEQHFAFTRRFGALEHTPQRLLELAREGLGDRSPPDITVISNVVENGVPIGRLGNAEAFWHTDSNFAQVPPAASLLRALEVPPEGGNTSFMNMYRALDSLPRDLRQAIDGRHCKHDTTHDSAGVRRPGYGEYAHPREAPGPVHPLIRTHAETGREALYLGRRLGAWVVGMEPHESAALLDAIWQHIIEQDLTWEHRWRARDLIMWDNRCTMHRRDAFDGSVRRVMHRTQLAGERPV
jgi:taurine dioxygenase